MFIVYFLLWTLMIYWVHRLHHTVPILKDIHWDHHKYVIEQTPTWHWNNLFLYNDTWMSTLDLWTTEVIPTIIFCAITGQWWILVAYYLWAALVQERIEHNPNFNIPFLTSGKDHLIHHQDSRKNYGLFISIWDRLFGTWEDHRALHHRKQLGSLELR